LLLLQRAVVNCAFGNVNLLVSQKQSGLVELAENLYPFGGAILVVKPVKKVRGKFFVVVVVVVVFVGVDRIRIRRKGFFRSYFSGRSR